MANGSAGGDIRAPGGGGEFRSTTAPKVGTISGRTFRRKEVRYSAINGVAIFEGDIALGSVEEMERRAREPAGGAGGDVGGARGIGITGAQFRWPKGVMPYEVDPALPNQQRVTDAIAHWEQKTKIRFVKRTAATAGQYPDYVLFTSQGGCFSSVGRHGGEQVISLGSGCTAGNAIHEIGHTVGLWHEQSREDRDQFVTVNWQNITPGMEHNFDQHITDGDDIGAYDYGSVMHYPRNAFTVNGQDTLVPTGGQAIGQRVGLSAGDIAAVRTLYPELYATPAKTPAAKKTVKKTAKKTAKKGASKKTSKQTSKKSAAKKSAAKKSAKKGAKKASKKTAKKSAKKRSRKSAKKSRA